MLDDSSKDFQEVKKSLEEANYSNADVKNSNLESFSEFEVNDSENINATIVANISHEVTSVHNSDEWVQVKGRAVFIATDETLFGINISAISEVYDRNQSLFEDIIRSIRIEKS